ncbi:hypothetical protein [Streptomyces alboflavus]|uniref:hypothetical protein n=1 Tax=Streptomyces alboflavus TaxID=67267 RepID=UPI0004CCB388|nr:hypothetical protein [Streptomyces alboflavus]
MSRFDVRLPSSRPGIAFTARITATVLTRPPYPDTPEEVAGLIRAALREAAYDIAGQCDPLDLVSASDICTRHLSRSRSLATKPPVEFRADLRLALSYDDRAAIATLLDAQRRQAVADALRQQMTQALAEELADPAAVLARWFERGGTDWNELPDTARVQDIAEIFAGYRPTHEQGTEHQVLELLREFLSSFPEPAQKRMLYAYLAAGMRGADRPQHAAKAQALLNGHTSPSHPLPGDA